MSFQITVEPSGRTFSADNSETLLAAGIRQGIGLPYGCKDGACGSCKCKKISGTVVHGEHQAKALSAEEEAQGLISDLLFYCAKRFGAGVSPSHTRRQLSHQKNARAGRQSWRRNHTT
jgi:ferredoxin